MWQFAQSRTHLAASSRALSSPREWPRRAIENDLRDGSTWWNESARVQRS